jgi:hypothetical protein
MNDSSERSQAAQFMERFNRGLGNCSSYKTGNFVTERESEGVWIIWPLDCGDKIFTLAYLRINDRLMLGDIGSETK